MPSLSLESDRLARLRARAVTQLDLPDHRSRPRTDPAPAMAALIDLAAVPATAPKALALLHELQVHQVELELQNEDLRQATAALEATLRIERARFQALPLACLVLGPGDTVEAANDEAASWLGTDAAALPGTLLLTWLTPDSALALQALRAGGDGPWVWTLAIEGRAPRPLVVRVARDPACGATTLAMWPAAAVG